MGLRRAFTFASAILIFTVPLATAQTVERRARLGNNIEDITFISTGPLANSIVLANGAEIFVAPLHPRGGPSAPTTQSPFFDVRSTPVHNAPRGITFLPNERLLAFHGGDDGVLYLVDESGTYRGSRTLRFPGAQPTYTEGIDYVPPSSPVYPNHIALVVNTFTDTSLPPSIALAAVDGTVDAIVAVQPFGCDATMTCAFDPVNNGILGLAYQSPGRLLVSLADGTDRIWAIDFSGNVIGNGPVNTDAGVDGFEGIVQLPDGRVIASNYFTGQLLFFDRDMTRTPADDRVYSVGIGVTGTSGLAWDGDTSQYLSLHQTSILDVALSAISPTLDAATSAPLDLSQVPGHVMLRMAYVPDVHAVAMLSRTRQNAFINFIDASSGTVRPEMQITVPSTALQGIAQSLEYIPDTNEFVLGVNSSAGNSVVFVSRTTPAVTRRFAVPDGITAALEIAYDPANGGRLLLSDNLNLVVTDANGSLLPGGFNFRADLRSLQPRDLAKVTTGPDAGSFAVADSGNSELIVFRIP